MNSARAAIPGENMVVVRVAAGRAYDWQWALEHRPRLPERR
jgi:hypothetical protein